VSATINNKIVLNKNSISLAGEFAILSQLSLRGFDANLTLGHTKGVDILISDPNTGKMFKMEVKTKFGNNTFTSELFGRNLEWIMSIKHETISYNDLFYCFVNIHKETLDFRFFIVPSMIVAKYVKEHHRYWLKVRGDVVKDNPIRIFRLGLDNAMVEKSVPLAVNYENQWNLNSAII